MIKTTSTSSNWFINGIPSATQIAKWQKSNSSSNTQYPDMTGIIKYQTNSKGYRDVEWTDSDLNDSIWCLGHSDVFGVGVESVSAWPAILEKLTGVKTINLGVVGGSWDTISRIVFSGLSVYRPKQIFIQATTLERREYISDKFQSTVLPAMSIDMLPHNEIWKYIDSTNSAYSYEKNIALINSACRAAGVKVHIFEFTDRWDLISKDPAVDLEHIGPATHAKVAEYLNKHYFDR